MYLCYLAIFWGTEVPDCTAGQVFGRRAAMRVISGDETGLVKGAREASPTAQVVIIQ